ncbi:ankyrin repeat domain-containing protein [Wolbachia pipientis]|uniref:ankyrin repeat domain-containing protein n=1 Tax=Wolbachia pipientis TaxID=955 RepID=UPI00202EB545|nr:ankyrin repeat domain-containing protein [Wolbachia pipientis]
MDKDGSTPLHIAALAWFHKRVLSTLIENGVNPLLKNKDGETPRDLAQDSSVKKFLEKAEEKQLKHQAFT